jgi:PadR family transcriptional regulator, regulatory protein PadR
MDTADYLLKLERDMTGGFLHLLVLDHIHRIGPIHGYGLIKAMEESTGERGQWKEGTLYPLLGTMEKEGLLRSRWGKGSEGPRRKYYEITPAGREVRELAILKWRRLRRRLDTILEDEA